MLQILVSLALGAAATAVVESYRIGITRVVVASADLPRAFVGFTIVQLSDLHTTQYGRLERRAARLLTDLEPDLLVVTGDLIPRESGLEPVCRLLSDARARSGKFAVFGNSENGSRATAKLLVGALPASGVKLLRNEHVRIERGGESIVLAGVEDPFTGHANLTKALGGVGRGEFTVLLAHSPGITPEAVDAGVDLVLSGHTHGGQLRLPLLPPPYTHLQGAPKLISGMYDGDRLSRLIGRDAGPTRVYVSRGVGSSYLPVRLFCRPEIVLLTLTR